MSTDDTSPATNALAEIARGLMRDRSLLLELVEGVHPNGFRREINLDTVRLRTEIGRLDAKIERITEHLLEKGGANGR